MSTLDSGSDARTGDPSIPIASDDTFDELVRSASRPVVVDFFATWCGPCQWILPTLESIRDEYSDRVDVVKVDVDAAPRLAERFRIASVPTVILFVGGEEVERSIGVEPDRVKGMPARALAPDSP
ncbi:MAG: thioredoxin [Gemmatimonadales bacterium]|nr:MAG: thioredoxin [Gemmatimonadales bacterium]